jgi:hypothetical protein
MFVALGGIGLIMALQRGIMDQLDESGTFN